MKPQPGQYWKMRCGTIVYIIGVAPMLYLPLISVDSTGFFHRHLEDGTAHSFLHRDSVEDLVEHLPDYPGFPFPPDAFQAPLVKAEEVAA
ncbi:hypothetical protein VN12_04110 [Pirellula sp. SH-Sr6A]|uniref:hypothetical protein n=1 Tax=Pirellula sp. SH-Sr6A TaxID=1632865 RepID=UPI00078EF55B|nr:hypothetical protein [Pirellula sp. SH-Sr6A]AMV31277.1 hypothetical protein VN12_04110 [Pirellula sp. SH-Sr6A]